MENIKKKNNKPSSRNIWRKRSFHLSIMTDFFFFLLSDTHTQPWAYGWLACSACYCNYIHGGKLWPFPGVSGALLFYCGVNESTKISTDNGAGLKAAPVSARGHDNENQPTHGTLVLHFRAFLITHLKWRQTLCCIRPPKPSMKWIISNPFKNSPLSE